MSCRTGAVLLGAAIVMATLGGPFASFAAAQDRTVLPVPIPDFAGKSVRPIRTRPPTGHLLCRFKHPKARLTSS
jgi:hypothetical protein